ncbi:MAG: alpha/beta hydrolase [Solirubrobacterales bacterium]|jgi:pimeloyl-ACP methyl ester carboxylesterase|nr:alpha/beta hydrolase [Solirubrobacterales bacterium]
MTASSAPPPDPGAFATHHATLPSGTSLAYLREGAGGFPLLLVHGWPETKRLWWKVVAPLAAAGFEVIAPDLRGFGDSDADVDGFHDLAAHSADLHALVRDVLGHERIATAGGDMGGGVIQDLGLRYEGLVARQVLFNCILPMLPEQYAAAGIDVQASPAVRQAADYFVRQGRHADDLAAELDTPERRRRYIEQFYGARFWGTPGGFTREDVDFMTEPFADGERLRASFGNYESAQGRRPLSGAPRWFAVSDLPTLALYGPDDHVMYPDWPDRCQVAFRDLTGPYVVPRAGHFLPWERPELFAKSVVAFLRDLLR